MPIDKRQTALTTSVIVFFIVSIIGIFNNVGPEICCKRAIIAMIIAYFLVSIIVRFINYLVIDAMASRQVDKIVEKFRNINGPANRDR